MGKNNSPKLMGVEVYVVSKCCGLTGWDLNVDSMKKYFYKQALQKRTQDVFRVKTFTRKKKIKVFVKWDTSHESKHKHKRWNLFSEPCNGKDVKEAIGADVNK